MLRLLTLFNEWLNNFLWNIESKKRKTRLTKIKNE